MAANGGHTNDTIDDIWGGNTIPSDVTPGTTYYVWALADANGNVTESNENNNWGQSSGFTIKYPDLVASVTGTNSSYSIGEKVHATVTVTNQGAASAGSSKVKYYLGTSSNKTWKYIQDADIGGLAANGGHTNDTIDDIWGGNTIPSDVTPGTTYYVWALADANGNVTESNENNNWGQSSGFTIKYPDLVASVTGTNSSYSIGEKVHATVTVTNQGAASAGSSKVKYYLGTSSNKTWKYIQDGDIGGLAANGGHTNDTIDDIWGGNTIPSDVTPGTTYYVWALADANGNVTESNENNNWGQSSGFTIKYPDLIVTQVIDTLTSYNVGEKINAKVTIKNNGQASAGSSKLYYYLGSTGGSASSGPSTIYKNIQEGSISSLSINSTEDDIIGNWITGGWTIPADVAVGSYRIWVKADYNGQISESAEDNNWGSSAIFELLPEAVVTSLSFRDATGNPISSIYAGQTVYLRADATGMNGQSINVEVLGR